MTFLGKLGKGIVYTIITGTLLYSAGSEKGSKALNKVIDDGVLGNIADKTVELFRDFHSSVDEAAEELFKTEKKSKSPLTYGMLTQPTTVDYDTIDKLA